MKSQKIHIKIFLLSISILLFYCKAEAQNIENFHINLFAGAANYEGDLQDKRYTFQQARFAGGLGLSYDLTNHFSIRGMATIAEISANDKYGKNKNRNLNFTSKIYEAQLGLEYYITPLADHALTPYLFASIAIFHFSPYTYDTTGKKVFLEPLSTEGEGFVPGVKKYNLNQLAIPFGGGVKLSLSENINVGIEVGFRKLFTSYLDDVSGNYVDEALLLANRGSEAVELAYRGNELKNSSSTYPAAGSKRGGGKDDWYYFTGVTVSFRLGNGLLGSEGQSSRRAQYLCPKNVM